MAFSFSAVACFISCCVVVTEGVSGVYWFLAAIGMVELVVLSDGWGRFWRCDFTWWLVGVKIRLCFWVPFRCR